MQPTSTVDRMNCYAVLARLGHNSAVAMAILALRIQSVTTPIPRPVVVATTLAGALIQASPNLVRNRVVNNPSRLVI